MKTMWILVLAAAGIGGLAYLALRKRGDASATGISSDEAGGQSKFVLTDTTTAAPGTSGGDTLTIGSEQAAGSERNSQINDAQANVQTKSQILPGINFVSAGVNPVTSEPQSIFEIDPKAPLDTFKTVSGFKNEKGFAGFTYIVDKPDSKGFPFAYDIEGGKNVGAIGFVELLPTGSGSTAANVIQTGVSSHPGTVVAPATLKPGDPGYEAALASARARTSQARSEAPKPKTEIASAAKTVKLGNVEIKGNFAIAAKQPEAKKAEPPKSSASKLTTSQKAIVSDKKKNPLGIGA